jgi:hypothetical protein
LAAGATEAIPAGVWAPTDTGSRCRPNVRDARGAEHSMSEKRDSMKSHTPHKPHRTPATEGDDAEPGMLPVEPDKGPVQPAVPSDPEHDRVVDPEA